jgi:hypothetical protein
MNGMIESQIYTALLAGIPTMATVLIGILINNSRLNDMNGRISDLRSHLDTLFSHVDTRFDDMRVMWQSELHRVEEVLDARLRHLEEN